MATYTGADILGLAQDLGAAPALARCMAAAAMAEGGGDSEAVGDNGTSLGAFQINDIHGLTREERFDLVFATRWMLDHEFTAAWDEGVARGYTDETLARWCCMRAERPYGWLGPDAPGLNSPAADRYADHWRALEEPMPENPTAYDPETPRVAQTDAWSCSVATTAWMLRSVGKAEGYPDPLEGAMLADGLVSREKGLLVGSAGPLAEWVARTFGLQTHRSSPMAWDWLVAHAGTMPIALGGARWGAAGHWVAVRGVDDSGYVRLANPAEGYAGIFQTLTERDFNRVAPCSAWWILAAEEEEDMGQITDLINKLGYLQGDVADRLEQGLDGVKRARSAESRAEAVAAIQAAINTLRRGGDAPEEEPPAEASA